MASNQLRLTGDCIADLYPGKITRWNDPKFKEHNPGMALPDLPVTPIHRSDSTGTTLLTTTYLSRASEPWRNGPRAGNVVQWPQGKSGRLNAGVAEAIKATPGAIGYVKNSYAVPRGLTTTQLMNHSGKFVKPERPNFYAAIDATDWTKPGFVVDMIDLDGPDVWPVLGPCYAVVCTNPAADKVESVRNTLKFFDWALNHGDEIVRRMGNACFAGRAQQGRARALGYGQGPERAPDLGNLSGRLLRRGSTGAEAPVRAALVAERLLRRNNRARGVVQPRRKTAFREKRHPRWGC